MKKFTAQKIVLAIFFSCLLSSFLTFPAYATAGLNRTINFQGKVVNKADGTNISDGNYTFIFKIYDLASGGTKLWGDETQTTIPVTSGIFTVALGSIRTFATDNLDFNQDNLWLDVTFNGENFGSRVRLASVPYAMTAEKVNGLTVTSTTGMLTIQNAKTISFADAFTTSGANPLTLTTTGTTNVTLPTTGTLFTNTATGVQTLTSTQTTGTILGIADSTTETAALIGQSITLSGTGAFDQTGLQFNLSNATGTNLNDIVGSGSTWKVSKAGALTVASCTGCGAGGGGYATIQDEGSGLTQRTTVNFIGSGINCVDNAGATKTDCTISGGGGGVSLAPAAADNPNSANNAIFINQSGSGDLLKLQKSGLDTFSVANNGGLTISATTSDIVKTTTGTTNASDFSLTGSILTNVASQNDNITILEGTVPNSGQGTFTAPATVTTSAAAGAGSQTILREDGQYIIIHGNGLTTGSRWDGSTTGAMSATTTAPSTAAVGAGAIALKRPDGRYLVINGGGSLGTTSLFDPYGATATAAGPAVCGGGATTTGTNAFLRDDGKYLIICGGLTAWGIYDPTANTYTAGTAVGTAFGAGAFGMHRDNGTFLIFAGGNVTTHWLYNPYASNTGTMTLNPITTNALTITTGAFAIRRVDGKFLVMGGAVNTSSVYDPTPTAANSGAGSMTAQSGAGFGPTAALADGASSSWREDGKYTLIIGAGSTVSNVIDPSKSDNTQFTVGAALAAAPGAGFHAFFRPNGQYQLIRGGASTATDLYDIGYVIGGQGSGVQLASYETECITATSLNTNSTLNWTSNSEGTMTFQVKTGNGACSGSYENILNSGDSIRPTSGDNRIQIKVFFQRQLPYFVDQEWGLRRGLGQVRYRRINQDPVLFDISVDNSNLYRRTQFDFGEGGGSGATATDPSGPVIVNLTNSNDRRLSLELPAGIGWGSTINSTNASLYNGAWSTAPAGLASAPAAGSSDIVMRRPDGKFMIVTSNATANAQVYDPAAQTITAQSGAGNVPSAIIGVGALSFKRPDGKFFIVHGGAGTVTNIYDPVASTFTAGPATTAAVGHGAQLIPLPTGRMLIVHGNSTTGTSIYDPVQNVMYAGPVTTAAVTFGSILIPRPDGKYVLALGQTGTAVATCPATLLTVSNTFDPYWMTFTAAGSPAITGGPGAFTFQRSDGLWVIVRGGATATTCAATTTTDIYNPYTNKVAAGSVLSAVAQMGAHAIPRPDGAWLIVHGSATSATTTSIYLEKAGVFTAEAGGQVGQFVAGPALATGAGAGAVSFQRPDGKFVTLVGNATATLNQYDGGWVATGTYKSEQTNIADLDTSSTLVWKANTNLGNISAEVRTATTQLGLQTALWREIGVSGGLINPGASETWFQVNFNFKRSFLSFGGRLEDVWFTGGGSAGFYYPQRPIVVPTLSEYKVTKDIDLVNLKSDGLSMFRVSSSGDIFTSNGGSVNTGGADLAENYTSQVPLEKGEVVSIDPQNNHGVMRTTYQYQPDVLGVVSTAPGFVAGSYTKDSYPIALVGRVPVKVSTENGTIRIGDQLTSSSVPGYAMKAIQSGRVLGTVLENLDMSTLTDCPASDVYVPNRKCGTIMMFVNLTNYFGAPAQIAMQDHVSEGNVQGLDSSQEIPATQSEGFSIIDQNAEKDLSILAFLNSIQQEREKTIHTPSEIFTDRVSAVEDVISPKIITDLLIAKKIKADSIEGLEIWTNKIGSLEKSMSDASKVEASALISQDPLAEVAKQNKQLESSVASLSATLSTLKDFNVASGSSLLTFSNGMMVTGGGWFDHASVDSNLVLGSNLTITSNTIDTLGETLKIQSLGQASISFMKGFITIDTKGNLKVYGDAEFHGDVQFMGRPSFNADTAGFAVIKKDAREVALSFEKEYKDLPIVTASIAYDFNMEGKTDQEKTAQTDLEQKILNGDMRYIITQKTKKGFKIKINKNAEQDVMFSWNALSVKNVKTTVGDSAVAGASTQISASPSPIISTDEASPSAVGN